MNQKIANQRDWIWRGWRIHYRFQRVSSSHSSRDIPIILLHGFGASSAHWRYNIPFFSQNHTVYAIDLLGFGISQKVYTDYDVNLWSQLVADFWNTFIKKPCIIIGNSLGSLIALNTVVKYPFLARGLVMLSLPDISARQKMIPSFLQSTVKTIENLVASPLLIRLIFPFVSQPNFIRTCLKVAYIDHTNINDELVEIISSPPQDKGAIRALIALTKSMKNFSISAEELLRQVNIPILLIWGKLDRLVPPSNLDKFLQLKPNISGYLLDNLGHCIHDEKPRLFHDIYSNWISNL